MVKHSDEWCEAVAGKLVDTLAEFDADEADVVLCMAFTLADESGRTAAEELRELADALDADNRERAH